MVTGMITVAYRALPCLACVDTGTHGRSTASTFVSVRVQALIGNILVNEMRFDVAIHALLAQHCEDRNAWNNMAVHAKDRRNEGLTL
jgi:hypothetical protein